MPQLREIRREKFIEQRELAEMVGVSEATISNWETGKKRPRLANVRKLAEALHVQPSEIEFPAQTEGGDD